MMWTRLPLLAALLLVLGFALLLPAWSQANFDYSRPQVKTLLSQGSAPSKVDLVFVADGYTASRSSDFERDARDALQSLWQYPLFKDYRQHFNAYSVFVPSLQDGTRLRYAFGSTLNQNGQGMVTLDQEAQVRRVVQQAPAADVVIVLTTLPGRAHAGEFVVLPGRRFEPLPHELGHKMANLGDEYSSLSSLADRRSLNFGSGDIPHPNLTLASRIDPTSTATIRKTAKWGAFLDLPNALPLVSAYQGGFYQAVGVWRPSYACIMGGDGAPFCPVCHKEMVKAIYAQCSLPFDDASYHRRHPLSQWR